MRRAKAGDRRAADAALLDVRPRILVMVKETFTSGDLRDRLESAAMWAAWKAIRAFDPRRSPSPKAYVLHCARLRIWDLIGKEAARAQEVVSLDTTAGPELELEQVGPSLEDQLAGSEAQRHLDRATADLTPADLRLFERFLRGADLDSFARPGHAQRVVAKVRGRLVGCGAYSLTWTGPPPAIETEPEQLSLWEIVSR